MERKRPVRRQRKPIERPPVDRFKVFHVSVALAPVFAREYLDGKIGLDHEDVAEALVDLATAIVRRCEAGR